MFLLHSGRSSHQRGDATLIRSVVELSFEMSCLRKKRCFQTGSDPIFSRIFLIITQFAVYIWSKQQEVVRVKHVHHKFRDVQARRGAWVERLPARCETFRDFPAVCCTWAHSDCDFFLEAGRTKKMSGATFADIRDFTGKFGKIFWTSAHVWKHRTEPQRGRLSLNLQRHHKVHRQKSVACWLETIWQPSVIPPALAKKPNPDISLLIHWPESKFKRLVRGLQERVCVCARARLCVYVWVSKWHCRATKTYI